MSKKIRTILVDDHALVLEGLRGLLEQFDDIEVVSTAQSGDQLMKLLDQHHEIDVVVLDIQMPSDGLKTLAEIRRRNLPVRVLILTAFGDGESLQMAIELEAEGVALKTEAPTQTVEAIRQIAHGRLVFPRAAQRWLTQRQEAHILSPREREVLKCVAQGSTNPEIAEALLVSENTIRFHLKNIFEKLHVTNRTEAAAWYFQNEKS